MSPTPCRCLPLLLALAAGPALAGAPPSGTLLSSSPCAALPPHEKLDDFGRKYFAAAEWEEARGAEVECREIRYASDGLSIPGWILTPRPDGQYPAILHARGGTGDYGRVDALTLAELRLLARAGYVVLATDYRFTGEQARRDEFGGADLRDLLHLAKLAQGLETVERGRLFLHGLSRGGVMAYMAIREGIPVRAAAVIAGPTDLAAFAKQRPDFVAGNQNHDGWAKVWPDFERRKEEHFRDRSAVAWAERIQVPVLILHSRTDNRVPVSHALALAARLQEAGREYELVVYGKDGHSLPEHRRDRNQAIIRWFRAHDPGWAASP